MFKGNHVGRRLGFALGAAAFCLASVSPGVLKGQSATAYYVRAGATGAANGLDWTNAFQTLPATLTRGQIYYIADGSYPSYTFSTPAAQATVITIKKATPASHGTSTGWLDTYGDGTANWAPITFNTSHWRFDGATGGGPGSWKSGHGFRFNNLACENAAFVSTANGLSNITIRHVSFTQTGNTEVCSNATVNAAHGIFTSTGGEGSIYDSLFEYLHFDNLGGLPFFMRGGRGNVIQYNYSGNICGKYVADVNAHCAMTVVHGMEDMHFRYNYLAESPSSGGFVKNDYEVSTGIYIYGNVFRDGLPIACNTGTCDKWWIMNNTFTDLVTGPVAGSGKIGATSVIYNNLVYAGKVISFSTSVNHAIHDYTWYSRIQRAACHMLAAPHDNVVTARAGGCDAISEAQDPFVDSTGNAPEDFRLVATIGNYAGRNVCEVLQCGGAAAAFNRDAFGRERGSDGTLDRGAYEHAPPTAPSNLRLVRP